MEAGAGSGWAANFAGAPQTDSFHLPCDSQSRVLINHSSIDIRESICESLGPGIHFTRAGVLRRIHRKASAFFTEIRAGLHNGIFHFISATRIESAKLLSGNTIRLHSDALPQMVMIVLLTKCFLRCAEFCWRVPSCAAAVRKSEQKANQ